jgi:spore germination protein GerM
MLLAAVMMVTAVSGCSLLPFGRPSAGPGEDPITPGPGQGEVALILYFADSDAMYLVPEERVVTVGGESYAQLVIRELLAGPRTAGLGKTIPDGVQLLSIEIVEGVAFVNFSREIQTNHWGGSTGEMFTIMSVVNSLTEDPGITAVQFLIEGQRVESLVGHADTTVPIERHEDIIRGGN